MTPESYAVVALSLIVISALIALIFLMRREHERILDLVIRKAAEKEIRWEGERLALLDRIQAPTFDHLKHHEVRVIKAQNGAKDPPQLEQL